MADSEDVKYVLGLDIGSNSIGWALLRFDRNEKPLGIERCGARIFEAGIDGKIAEGDTESRAAKRRVPRGARRLYERRARRNRRLARSLQHAGFWPAERINDGNDLHRFLQQLDRKLISRAFSIADDPKLYHTLPYWLRAKGLSERLELDELGRAIYSLAQKRGFKSNRKNEGEIRDGATSERIGKTREEMTSRGLETLGQLAAARDVPFERIRGGIPNKDPLAERKQVEEEFNRIWKKQAEHHAALSEELRKKLFKIVFHQRPVWWRKTQIGRCEHKPTKRRAPKAILKAQRFRYLQSLNNVAIGRSKRPLTSQERATLVHELERCEELTFDELRTLLPSIPSSASINLEEGDVHKSLIGNKTAARLRRVFGETWERFSEDEQERIVDDVRSFENRDALKSKGMKKWGLSEEQAEKLAKKVELETGYFHLSSAAISELLPFLEKGKMYGEIERKKNIPKEEELSSFHRVFPDVKNPVVARCMAELRSIVNELLREIKRPPYKIRIELARDVLVSQYKKKDRQEQAKQNRIENAKAKKEIAQWREIAPEQVGRWDIVKWKLYKECCPTCPYTGETINEKKLFGPDVQVEHIIPRRYIWDNSFANLTLCMASENATKGRRTPFEAYGSQGNRYDDILNRVGQFKRGPLAAEKLRRFKMNDQELRDFLAEFTTRQLNDTRYAARIATEYLARLYGGRSENGKLRIEVTRGKYTSDLRQAWRLKEQIPALFGSDDKRSDHRHHAIDAIVVALTDTDTSQKLQKWGLAGENAGTHKWWKFAEPPWPTFVADVLREIDAVSVSHMPKRKVNGALHEGTYYSLRDFVDDKGKERGRVRKALKDMSLGQVKQIADPLIRSVVLNRLKELGSDEPKRAFSNEENLPILAHADKEVRVRRAAIHVKEALTRISIGTFRERRVISGSNHHVEILGVPGGDPKDMSQDKKWVARNDSPVTTLESQRRLKTGRPVVDRRDEGKKIFRCSLSRGDTIELDNPKGGRGLYVVTTLAIVRVGGRSYVNVYYAAVNDANRVESTSLVNQLGELNCRKIAVTPAGEKRSAND